MPPNLNTHQAQAIYTALRALNEFGIMLHARGITDPWGVSIDVLQRRNDTIVVGRRLEDVEHIELRESYGNPAAFALAYGIVTPGAHALAIEITRPLTEPR